MSKSDWLLKEWRIPRRGEVVRDPNGTLGRVFRIEGSLKQRFLWVLDIDGEEMYAREPAELFETVDLKTEKKFQLERYERMGYRPGALCSFKKKPNVPLEILQLEWNPVRYKMIFCLKNLREFESEVLKTEEEELIPIFNENFPSLEGIFSLEDSGLKYRLNLSISSPKREGWGNNGSPWEFSSEEAAIAEMENWKSRLKIRRVASVLGADWEISLPCWTVEASRKGEDVLCRVVEVKTFNGSPGYFKSALHAALAMKMLPKEDWMKALVLTQDALKF